MGGYFTEQSPYRPNSPYSASKAAADHLVRAWFHTYGLPSLVTNCSNNYGPFQFPEKLIPLTIQKAIKGEAIPVYGDGSNVRDWLHVSDHVSGIFLAFTQGKIGETYVIGGEGERRNLEVAEAVCDILDQLYPKENTSRSLIKFVSDRPGHDFRYAIDAKKIKKELGWKPKFSFDEGLRHTVKWYLDHGDWVEQVSKKNYSGQRLGNYKAKNEGNYFSRRLGFSASSHNTRCF